MRKLVAALVLLPTLAEAAELTGKVTHVRDADTIEVGPIPIRLNGISAPELGSPIGDKGKTWLRDYILGREVRCVLNGDKTHDRFVGVCWYNGVDIGETVIRTGLALDCPRYSDGRYKKFETPIARETIKLPGYCD